MDITRDITRGDLLTMLKVRVPNDFELQKINQFAPSGQEWTAPELIIFPDVASTNLIHANRVKWSDQSLMSMGASCRGKSQMIDHSHQDTIKNVGFIYDVAVVKNRQLDFNATQQLLQLSLYPEYDQKILNTEGYTFLLSQIVVERSHPIVGEISYRRKNATSTAGFFRTQDIICPLCNISFTDPKCPHLMPGQEDSNFSGSEVAPYMILDGYFRTEENSFVWAGNCAQASIVDNQMLNVVI